MKLKFLGTCGGRFATASQRRRTAGIVIKTEETQIHLDPGPGGLVYSRKELETPEKTEAVIVSHAHQDHSSDTEPIIEMITELNEFPGALFANETCLRGYSDLEKTISNYHQKLCSRVEILEEGEKFEFKDLEIRSQEMFHPDPKTQGLILEDKKDKIGFWTDTRYSEELLEFYKGVDTLVINCVFGKDKRSKKHTTLQDVPKIVEEIEPKTTILTHFGLGFLNNLEENKEWIKEKTDRKVILAEDNTEFPGNRSLSSF